jgi:hypothetical protein
MKGSHTSGSVGKRAETKALAAQQGVAAIRPPLAEAHPAPYVNGMSNRASRQRRKSALAAIPRFTAKDLIGLKLMDIDWEPIMPSTSLHGP